MNILFLKNHSVVDGKPTFRKNSAYTIADAEAEALIAQGVAVRYDPDAAQQSKATAKAEAKEARAEAKEAKAEAKDEPAAEKAEGSA